MPALPACHISANLRARARSRARRIHSSMCEARATARAPQHRCIRDMCSPFLLPSLRTSSCGCSLVAGCVAADLRLEQTADCVQALVSGVMLEFGGHVAELWWKRTRRSLARTPMCGGSAAVACRRDRATGHTRPIGDGSCPSASPNRPSGDPARQRVAPAISLVSVRACVGVEQGERRIAVSACMSDAAGCTL